VGHEAELSARHAAAGAQLLSLNAFAASIGDYFDVSTGEEVEAELVPGLFGLCCSRADG
jgi:hypothetical protein